MPSNSRASAWVPGTSSPSFDRCKGVRLVENPSAPARSASSTKAAIWLMSSSVAGSLAAPRSPITKPRSGPCAICEPMSMTRGLAAEGVEVLGVAGPVPRDALDHGAAGDVLDAFHQRDQPVVTIGRGRGEPDAAVAHHHGRDAVPAGRRQPRIPSGLRVVVRVDVDEARCHQQAVGIDRAASDRARASGFARPRCDRRRSRCRPAGPARPIRRRATRCG